VMRSWGKAYVKWAWRLIRTEARTLVGCGTCTPLVTVNTSGAVS